MLAQFCWSSWRNFVTFNGQVGGTVGRKTGNVGLGKDDFFTTVKITTVKREAHGIGITNGVNAQNCDTI